MIKIIIFYESTMFQFIPEFRRISEVPNKVSFRWFNIIAEILFI